MRDETKTKKQLLEELAQLRQRIAELQAAGGQLAVFPQDVTERKQAEEALRESEERYRNALDSMLEGFQIIDYDWRYLYINDTAAVHGQRTKEELLGHTIMESYPGLEKTGMFAALRRCMDERTPHRMENEFTYPNGSKAWFELSIQPVPEGICVLSLDITERKQTDEALREANDTLRALVEGSPLAIVAVDPEGKVKSWNAAAQRTFGWSESEVLGRFNPIVPQAKVAEFADLRQRALRGEVVRGMETVRQTKEGTLVHVAISVGPLFDAKGQVSGVMGLIADITERKEAEEALRRSYDTQDVVNSLLRLSLEEAPVEQILKRALDRLFSTSWLPLQPKGAFFVVENDPELLVMKAQTGLTTEVRQACATVPFGTCLCGRAALTGEMQFADRVEERHETHYGGMIPHGHYCVPFIHAGTVLGVLNIYLREGHQRNQAEEEFLTAIANTAAGILARSRAEEALRRSEQQLLQAQKMEAIGNLAGGVAHDFNNLLTVILGHSQLMLERLDERDPLRRGLEQIHNAGERAAALTRQLLAFGRRQVLRPEVQDLNTIVANIEPMLQRIIGEDIDLVFVREAELGWARVDEGQIEQVIMNLATNSRDAMPKGGKLTIETANVYLDEEYASRHIDVTPGPHVMLAVSDTGVGMDKETQSHIFEPFFTTKEEERGTGLGLSTVYGIVKQSGGNIWVYSEPGKGTTFKVYLPRVSEEPEPKQPSTVREERLGGTETILVAEDDEAVRELVCHVCESSGYTLLVARNAGEALLTCERYRGKIDLMLTDVVMPQMSGPELAERLAPTHPEMKVLFMSGYTDNAIVHHGVLEPGTAFIQKPFTPHALARKVREVLDTP